MEDNQNSIYPPEQGSSPEYVPGADGMGYDRNTEQVGYDPYMEMHYGQRAYYDGMPVYTDGFAGDDYNAAYRDEMEKAVQDKNVAKRKNRARFVVGLAVMVFAVFGFACAAVLCVKGISSASEKRERELFAKYTSMLIPVAAVSPEPFEDLSDAAMEDLIKIAVWSVIDNGADPGKYAYTDSEMRIPAADVEAAYYSFFGAQRPIAHCSADGYGYMFKYSEEDNAYFIPMTTLEPVYTPRVVSAEAKNGTVTVECEMINTSLWKQDPESGALVRPDADMSVRIVLRSSASGMYISSLTALSVPETALPSVPPAAEPPLTTAPNAEQTTEGQSIVITWD